MNITNIQAGQISQKAVTVAEKVPIPVTQRSGVSVSETATPQTAASSSGASVGFSLLKEQLNDILLSFPPFFPIGKYQRLDLIKAVKGVQEQVEKSSLSADLKKPITAEKLPTEATDQQITTSLEKLNELRDTLTQAGPSASGTAQPGSILSITV